MKTPCSQMDSPTGPRPLSEKPYTHGEPTSAATIWYREQVRPFLERIGSKKLEDFDRDAQRLGAVARDLDKELAVCFLGDPGVGKSTLINALTAGQRIVLPAGGLGPLTAQKLEIRYSAQPRFEAEYHSAEKLNQLIFALENGLRLERKQESAQEHHEPAPPLEAEQRSELTDLLTQPEGQGRERLQQLKKQAQLLVRGNQDSEASFAYLIDGIRQAMGHPPAHGTQLEPDDEARAQRVSQALNWLGKDQQAWSMAANQPGFDKALEDHAAGFLAPLIRELRVYWNSDLLQEGLALIDLPGVGAFGDIHQEVTTDWIREKAKAIVLVVDTRGVKEPIAALLHKSGFLSRLMYAVEDPREDPVLLILAVVKLDDAAKAKYGKDKTRKPWEHFELLREETKEQKREGFRTVLTQVCCSGDTTVGQARQRVIDALMEDLQVHPVSAPEYRRVLEQDDDDLPFIKELGQSGIPELIEQLRRLARDWRARRTERIRVAERDFVERVRSTLQVHHAQWKEETRAQEEAERLRGDLEGFLEPLRKEYHVRQGQYREFLKNSLPERIKTLVGEAQRSAQKEIKAYLEPLKNAHYKVLQAAVCRGGTYDGARHIDLPVHFALRFEEPIAAVWGKAILKEIRCRTKEFAEDIVALVEQIVGWAKGQGSRVQPQLAAALRDEIQADAKKLDTVGKEMVNELREEVKNQLIHRIEKPIREKCRKFVKDDQNIGTGVRSRIIKLFEKLAEEVTEAAAKPALDILTKRYEEVQKEILAVFQGHQDPLAVAKETLVASREQQVKHSDARKRKQVIAELATIFAACPASEHPAEACP